MRAPGPRVSLVQRHDHHGGHLSHDVLSERMVVTYGDDLRAWALQLITNSRRPNGYGRKNGIAKAATR